MNSINFMERARNGIGIVEAEVYIDEALRVFPEDGYFLKYRGELLWMRGKCADALEIFADAREKTTNGITHLELDKFLLPYSRQTAKTCQMLLDAAAVIDGVEIVFPFFHSAAPFKAAETAAAVSAVTVHFHGKSTSAIRSCQQIRNRFPASPA